MFWFGNGFVILISAFVMMWLLTMHQRTHAQAFMQEFRDLQLGRSSFADAQRLSQMYGGVPQHMPADETQCTPQQCQFAFRFENKPLSTLGLAKYTALFAFVTVQNGTIVARELEYLHVSNSGLGFDYRVADRPGIRHGEKDLASVTPQTDAAGTPRRVFVRLGPSDTANQRADAYSLDLTCLVRITDCNSPSAIYPPGIMRAINQGGWRTRPERPKEE